MRLVRHLAPQRRLVVAAVSCSLLNKLFDLAPPVLIGLAVDVVLLKEQSVLAGFGLRTAGQQLWGLALLTFVIWAAESLFEYLYDVLWRNLAQTTQHSLRLEAYDHLQKLELAFFEQDSTGRLMAVLNDDINQLERFLDRGANQILQLITTVLVVGIGMAMVAPEVSVGWGAQELMVATAVLAVLAARAVVRLRLWPWVVFSFKTLHSLLMVATQRRALMGRPVV